MGGIPEDITKNLNIEKLYFGYPIEYYELSYYITQHLSVFAILFGLLLTFAAVYYSRKTYKALVKQNDENNLSQRKYIKQARLIELSNEWNSKDMVSARNWANLIIKGYKDEDTDIYTDLYIPERLDKWVHISMVAHFFVRLERIESSGQINRASAKVEFKEAIGYWLKPLLRAYKNDPDEKALRTSLIELHNIYNSEKPYLGHP